jgi:cytochrome c biogenesis protein CcmG/thiol:disulfide interchange protein DsbE
VSGVELPEVKETKAVPARRRTIGLAVALGLLLVLMVVLAFGLRPKTSTVLKGHPAPDFDVTAFNGEFVGKRFALADLRGQVIVLNFFASWCVECDKEMPALEQAWRDYRDKGVWFVGVDYLDIDSAGLAYLARFGTTYPSGPDIGSRAYQNYQSTGVPETFFIDRQGIVQHVEIGPIDRSKLYTLLDQLTAGEQEQKP